MNQKGFASIILVLVIIVLIGVVGYFVWVKKQGLVAQQTTTPPSTATQALTPQIVTSAPIDEASDWKTYQNKKYGFEFKYAPQWKVAEFNRGVSIHWQSGFGEESSFNLGDIQMLDVTATQALSMIMSGIAKDPTYKLLSGPSGVTIGSLPAKEIKTDQNEEHFRLYVIELKDKAMLMSLGFEDDIISQFKDATGKKLDAVYMNNLFDIFTKTIKFL